MRTAKLKNMERGWFVGNFTPTLCATNDVEVAVKQYCRGDADQSHEQKFATEFSLVISGKVLMNMEEYVL